MPDMSRRVTSSTPSADACSRSHSTCGAWRSKESRADGRGRQATRQRAAQPTSASPATAPSFISLARPRHRQPMEIALTDRKGGVEPLKLPPGPYWRPACLQTARASLLGSTTAKRRLSTSMIWPARAAMRRLTFGGNNRFPIWSSDSKRVAFQSDRDGDLAIFWQSADGGAAERLTKPEQGGSHAPESWSPKGDTLLFSVTKGSDVSLWTFSLQDRKATPFGDVHSSNPTGAVFSPDGRWVAYTSTERDRTTIYVQPFPATGAKYQLPVGPRDRLAVALVTGRKGTVLQPGAGGFESVSVTTQPTFAFGNPVRCRDHSRPARPRREGLRHHTRWQVRWSDPSGTNRVRQPLPADPGGPQLVRGAEAPRASSEVVTHRPAWY